jgi:type IV secretion system protein VirD4
MPLGIIALLATFAAGAMGAPERRRQQRVKDAYDFKPKNAHGGARFATDKDLRKSLFGRKGIEVGFSPSGWRRLRYAGTGHLLLVAAARTGKAFTLLVNAILSLSGGTSLIVFDPKAELACITAHWRRRFGTVYIINPFGILSESLKGLKQARFNPMSILDPASLAFHSVCDKLAEALCPDDAAGNERHWILSARILISGIIAALAKYGKLSEKNLVAVRNVITGAGGSSVFEFCRECMTLDDPFIRQKLARFAAPGAEESKELNGVVSTADTLTGFMGNEAIAECLSGSDFEFHDLKRKAGTTVYVCLPLNKLDVCSKFFSLIMGTMLSDLLDEGTKGTKGKGAPVLAIVDEAAQIGPMRAFADAWGMAAGAAGLQIWAVYQDVSQIMNQFSKTWQTVIQNSGVTMWFGARDQQTRETVSKLAGVTEVISRSRTVTMPHPKGEPVVNDSASQATRPLIHPHEVGELASDEMLMFCENVPATIKAKRKPYTKTSAGRFRKNPYFGSKGFFNSFFD